MKYFTSQKSLPDTARYIGSETPDGYMEEAVADALDRAIEPAYIIEDGCRSFFDLQETEQ